MVIETLPPQADAEKWTESVDTKEVPAAHMLEILNDGVHTIYIDKGYLCLVCSDIPKQRNTWCRAIDFEKAYPEKWQEIQVELALRKLKNS